MNEESDTACARWCPTYLVPRSGRVHKPQISPNSDPTFRIIVYRGSMDLMAKDI